MKLTISQLRKIISEAIEAKPVTEVKPTTKEKLDPHLVTNDDFCGANRSFLDSIGFGGGNDKEIVDRTVQRRKFVNALRKAGYDGYEIEKAWSEACNDQGVVPSGSDTRNNPWD
jgi:hypothetical protein